MGHTTVKTKMMALKITKSNPKSIKEMKENELNYDFTEQMTTTASSIHSVPTFT